MILTFLVSHDPPLTTPRQGYKGLKVRAEVTKRAQKRLRLANDLSKKEPDACPNSAELTGTFRLGHDGTGCRIPSKSNSTNKLNYDEHLHNDRDLIETCFVGFK